MKPARIRLSRRKSFNLTATSYLLNGLGVRVVARPTRYGNPFVVKRSPGAPGLWDVWRGASLIEHSFEDRSMALRSAVLRYRRLLLAEGVRRRAARDLRGFNLACWCPLDQPCHADVLLEFANAAEATS